MQISHVRSLLKDTGLSPEQLGQRLQLSGMTLRRLLKKPDGDELPPNIVTRVRQGVYGLIIEGLLKPESEVAKMVVSESPSQSFEAAIHALGFRRDAMALGGSYPDQVLIGLSEIGASPQRQEEVRGGRKALARFRSLGSEWAQRVGTLGRVVASRKLTQMEKLSAYGALFYLITVFDLIPDTIPVFGVLDDFAILGIVAAYYVRKFPELFGVNVNAGP
jgi:uncharacterized membrane protein YkvA (DUF1232 family)